MQIDRDIYICGLRPVQLKALVRQDSFSTHNAMVLLDMPDPQISTTLRELAKAGWLTWGGEKDNIDNWAPTSLGHRLAASRLIRRFPVAQGRTILSDIVEKARRLNDDPQASRRITQIIVFGSVLTAADNQDAGDIDLVVEVGRRNLDRATLDALIEAEEQRMPKRLGFSKKMNRQSNDLQRAIKGVSNKISLHGFSDLLALSAPHRELYRYDLQSEAEIAPEPGIKVERDADLELKENIVAPPPLTPRPWPVPPNEILSLQAVDQRTLALAQHLWVKGVDIAAIADRLRMPEKTISAYLASRREAGFAGQPTFDINPRWMIGHAIGTDRNHYIVARIAKRYEAKVVIECEARDPTDLAELAHIRRFGSSEILSSGRSDILPIIESAARAVWAWWDKMQGQFIGLDLSFLIEVGPDRESEQALGTRRPDFRALADPMLELLEQRIPRPIACTAWSHHLDLEPGWGNSRLDHRSGVSHYPGSCADRITRRAEPKAWLQIDAVTKPCLDFIQASGGFTLSVQARQIAAVSQAPWRDTEDGL